MDNKELAHDIRDMLVTRGFIALQPFKTDELIKMIDGEILEILDKRKEIIVDNEIYYSTILQALRLYKIVFNFPPILDLMVKDGSIAIENGNVDRLIELFNTE